MKIRMTAAAILTAAVLMVCAGSAAAKGVDDIPILGTPLCALINGALVC